MIDNLKSKNIKDKAKIFFVCLLGVYIFYFLLTNFGETIEISSMIDKERILLVLLLSSLIHLLILPSRMWTLIRDMTDKEYSFFSYLITHSNSFLMSISPLGVIGTEATRFMYINWKNDIKTRDKLYVLFLDRLSGLIAVISFGGIFLFAKPLIATILIAPVAIFIIKVFFLDSLNIYKYSAAIIISLVGFIFYFFQLKLVLGIFVDDISIFSTVAIATVLVISGALPFSVLGLSLREVAFQQILIQMGFTGTMQ